MLEGSVLFAFQAPALPVLLAILAGAMVLVGGVLLWLRRRGSLSRDHVFTGVAAVGMLLVVLLLLRWKGEVRVNAYGFMLMCGFVAGTLTALRLAIRRAIPADRIIDLGLIILVGAIVGARVLYVLITKEPNGAHPPLIDPSMLTHGLDGLSFHGGLIGGFLTGGMYLYLTKSNFLRVIDAMAPAIAIGYAITRIGCFLNGCCYGAGCNLPWGIPVTNLHDHLTRHPVQLYASLMGLAMFGILLLLARGKSMGRAGRLFMVFLVLEGIERFVMEIYRQRDPSDHGFLTSAQAFSLVLLVIGIVGWYLVPNKPAVEALPEAPLPEATPEPEPAPKPAEKPKKKKRG
jgi:phosphatidylglycerol---prolipoprotein diacylglyceryl transferase